MLLDIHDNLREAAREYENKLSEKQIKRALANTYNAAQTIIKKRMLEEAAAKYNFSKSIFNAAKGYRIQRANATANKIESRAFVTSSPISMRPFVVSGGTKGTPPTVRIKNTTTLREGFTLGKAKKNAQDGSSAGVFMRIKNAAKVAPSKGRYAGRIATRGERKGQLILRAPIEKKYTLTTASVANAVYVQAMDGLDMAALFREKLEDQYTK